MGPIESGMKRGYAEARRRLFEGYPRLVAPAIEPVPVPVIHSQDWVEPPPDPYDAGPEVSTPDPGSYEAVELSRNPFHWRVVVEEVAKKHGIRVVELCSARRARELVNARHEAMWRLRNETTMSLPAIGRKLGGRDHTTVIHGIQRHEERIASGEAV